MKQDRAEQQDHRERETPTSPGRVLLIRALERVALIRHGHAPDLVALTFDVDGTIFVVEPARSQILGDARMLGQAFAAGRVLTYARPIGGGVPISLPPTAWELDDFGRRFASSAIALSSAFDASAAPTHRIFVDEDGLERLIRSMTGSDELTDDDDLGGDAMVDPIGPRPERYIRMPELRTMTGLSRATIYRRIGEGRFPDRVSLDGNVSVWRESEVADWIAEPR